MKKNILLLLMLCISMLALAQDKTYKIGDYYDDGHGVEGYVFEVSADGKHGKIVGRPIRRGGKLLQADYPDLIKAGVPEMIYSNGNPAYLELPAKILWIGATSKTDGAANTEKLWKRWKELKTKYNFGNNYLSDIEEALEWENKQDALSPWSEKWYIPAIEELNSFYAAVAQDDLNQLIKDDILYSDRNGDMSISVKENVWEAHYKIPQGYFWSSTQLPETEKQQPLWFVLDIRDCTSFFDVPNSFRYWCILIRRF